MREFTCPKCEFEQEQGEECPRCGIVFAKYQARQDALLTEDQDGEVRAKSAKGQFWRLFRIFRWASMGLSFVVLLLILKPAAVPEVEFDPDAKTSFGKKFVRFQKQYQSRGLADLSLNEAEINSWLDSNLAISDPVFQNSGLQGVALTSSGPPKATDLATVEMSEEELENSIRQVRIDLREQTLEVYVRFELYGKELSFQLEGYPRIEDQYLRLEPSSGRLGSLPIPRKTLKSAADRIFDSPENREKFRVPGHIRQIGVINGELSIVAF